MTQVLSRASVVAVVLVLAMSAHAGAQAVAPAEERHPIRNGAWIGAGAMAALFQANVRGCGTGCEMGDQVAMFGLAGIGIGAAGGALVGYALGRYAHGAEAAEQDAGNGTANRFFPHRPHGRLGVQYGATDMRSSLVTGRSTSPRLSLTWTATPYVSMHLEVTTSGGRYAAAPGAVPESVLSNLIAAPASRAASIPVGTESRATRYILNEMVGFHPKPWGRVRVELLAGVGVVAQEARDYYPERVRVGQTTEPSGKYYVLDFQTPETGLVVGVDAEVSLGHGLSVVPSVRYNRVGEPGPLVTASAGVHWRVP